jgi:hypothetical protein
MDERVCDFKRRKLHEIDYIYTYGEDTIQKIRIPTYGSSSNTDSLWWCQEGNGTRDSPVVKLVLCFDATYTPPARSVSQCPHIYLRYQTTIVYRQRKQCIIRLAYRCLPETIGSPSGLTGDGGVTGLWLGPLPAH